MTYSRNLGLVASLPWGSPLRPPPRPFCVRVSFFGIKRSSLHIRSCRATLSGKAFRQGVKSLTGYQINVYLRKGIVMEFFRGVVAAFVFTSFLGLLFLGGFLSGKAYRQEAIPEQCEETLRWDSHIGTALVRPAVSNPNPQAISIL